MSDRLRILMIAPQAFFRPRGTPYSVLHRIRALLRLGHTVDLVTYPFGESPQLDGLVIHRTPCPRGVHDVPAGPSFAKLLLDGPLFVQARRLARSGRFDLVHTHEEAGAMGARISRACGVPHLYDMHSSLPEQFAAFGRFDWWPVVGAFRWLERYTLDAADGVIVISEELRDHVVSLGYSRPLALLENVVDFAAPELGRSDVQRLRVRLGVGAAPVVLYTGSLESYQGIEMLIEAARDVRRQVGSARFVVVGGTEKRIGELEQFAEKRGVNGAFRFVSPVAPADVFVYHQMADVLVTARKPGTNIPVKLYQYLRAGKPIVATRIPAHTQVVDDATAELVRPEPGTIAAGIRRVLTDPARSDALAGAAVRLAERRFGEEPYFERLKEVLRQVIGTRSPKVSGSSREKVGSPDEQRLETR